MDRASNAKMIGKLGNEFSVRKKGAQNKFVKVLGYSMLTTKVSAKDVVPTVQRSVYEKYVEKFTSSKVFCLVDSEKIDYGFSRKIDAAEMSYSRIVGSTLCGKLLRIQ